METFLEGVKKKHEQSECHDNDISRAAGIAQWLEHSPRTNVARFRFPDPASNVG